MKTRAIITTYDRETAYLELVNDLAPQDCDIQAWNDGSKYNATPMPQIDYRQCAQNHGKKGYWKLWDTILKNQYGTDHDYFIVLPDDARVEPDFIEQAVKMWEAIEDRDKICLNLLMDEGRRGKKNWTSEPPKKVFFGHQCYYLSQWLDMCMIFTRRFLEVLEYTIKPVPLSRWDRDPKLSSGVGMQMSHRLTNNGFNIYQVYTTLVKTGHLPSKMNTWRNE